MAERKVVFPTPMAAILAVVFATAGAFHAAAIVFPNLAPSAPALRHGVFVAINACVAAGLALHRALSRGARAVFTGLFAILCVQQLSSHGADAWRAWTLDHRVDVASLGVLVVMPLTLLFLVRPGGR